MNERDIQGYKIEFPIVGTRNSRRPFIKNRHEYDFPRKKKKVLVLTDYWLIAMLQKDILT